jgi:Ser/Thr protein kinase RdoA (MazF antagonist)
MANFHNATENFEAPYESGRIDFLDTIAIRKWLDNLSVEMKTQDGSRKSIELLKPLLKEYYQLLDELEADLARTDLSALKKLYIHGDLHCFNMIFNHEKDRYISIVDFDFIREDYRLVDLLWTSHTTKWGYLVAQKYGKNALVEDFEPPESEMKAIEIEAIHLMVQEYRKYSELPSSELQHLPLLAKAFPFYNIRFFDFNNSEDECLQHINWFSWMIKNRLAYVDNIREAVSGL